MTTGERLTKIETDVCYIKVSVDDIKKSMIPASEFKLIKGIVLGFAGLILVTVCGLMVGNAIDRGQSSNQSIGTTETYIATPTPPSPFPTPLDDKKKIGLSTF